MKFFENLKKYFINIEKDIDDYTSTNSSLVSNPTLSYINWAMKLMAEGSDDIAIEKLETVTEMALKNPAACVNLAIVYIKRGDFDKVKPLLKKAIETDSQYARTYLVYGIFYTTQNDYEKACYYYEKASRLDARLPEVFVNWAIALTSIGKKQEAQEKFKKALFFHPQNIVGLYLWAVLDIDMNLFSSAREKLTAVLSFHPQNIDAIYHMSLLEYKEKNYELAIDYAKRGLEITKKNPLLFGILAEIYYLLQNYEKSFEIYGQIEKNGLYDEKTYLHWAKYALEQNMLDEAGRVYKSILKKNPDLYDAKLGLAKIYIKNKEYDLAKEILLNFLNSKNEDSEILLCLYEIEKFMLNYEKAIEYLTKAISLDVNNVTFYYSLGLLYEEIGDINKAKDSYKKMLEYDSKNAEVLYRYAKLYIDDDPRDALRKIRTAYNENKDNIDYAILYMKALIKNNHYKIALEVADEILSVDSENTEVIFLKVKALLQLDRYDPSINLLYALPQDKKDNENFDYLLLKAYFLRARATNYQNDINEMNDFSYYLSQKYSQNNKFMVKLNQLVETFKNEE